MGQARVIKMRAAYLEIKKLIYLSDISVQKTNVNGDQYLASLFLKLFSGYTLYNKIKILHIIYW